MSHEMESKVAREGFRGRHVVYALVGGALAGAIAAYLTAPTSGAELRARLLSTGERGRDKARHLPSAIKAATLAAQEAFVAALEESPHDKHHEAPPRHRESRHVS